MSAPTKTGLDYYPRDVTVSKDRKFVKAKIKYGYLALVVYDALLEIIYSDKGYYAEYSDNTKEEIVWNILDSLRGKYLVEADTVYDVIEMLVECRLFSRDHFKQGIITSKRIQETYYKATVERTNVEVDKNIWMLSVEEMKSLSVRSHILPFFDSQPNNEENQPNNEENRPNNSQSKGKESKGNKSKVNQSKSKDVCSELSKKAAEPAAAEAPVISLLLNTGKEYPIYAADVSGWEQLYPAVDIMQELRKMKGWLDSNPTRRKTIKGIKRFINNWLASEQDSSKKTSQKPQSKNKFNNIHQRDYSEEEIENLALDLFKEECQIK